MKGRRISKRLHKRGEKRIENKENYEEVISRDSQFSDVVRRSIIEGRN